MKFKTETRPRPEGPLPAMHQNAHNCIRFSVHSSGSNEDRNGLPHF